MRLGIRFRVFKASSLATEGLDFWVYCPGKKSTHTWTLNNPPFSGLIQRHHHKESLRRGLFLRVQVVLLSPLNI